MQHIFRNAVAALVLVTSTHALADAVFYQDTSFEGRSFSTHRPESDFRRNRLDNRASSVVVVAERWEVCDGAGYRGRCVVLRPGRYPSLAAMGLNNQISSARNLGARNRIDDSRYAPEAAPIYDNRRRANERLFEAEVTSARAVYGMDEQRCWTEREQADVARPRGNAGGAIIGAILGGILGHQVGHGTGKDIATVGGAVAGGAVGYNVGRDHNGTYSRDVQRCSGATRSSRPDYWAVTYDFRGQEHAIQTAYEPGNTVTVNRRGEPRAR